MDLGLQNKVALVTGASQGIGRAIALALAQEGCRLAICARRQPQLEATAAEIRATQPECLAISADATKPEDVRRVIASVQAAWQDIHILVNNVGGGGGRIPGSVEDIPEEKWLETYSLNALAAVRFTRLVIPHMRRAKWGRVVTVASRNGREGGGRPWYTMSKSAEISLMKTLARDPELARDGLTFNSVAPGRVLFPGNEWDQFRLEAPARFEQRMREQVPLGRAGTPEEVAALVTFLCSNKASLVNGACVAVDGGESFSF